MGKRIRSYDSVFSFALVVFLLACLLVVAAPTTRAHASSLLSSSSSTREESKSRAPVFGVLTIPTDPTDDLVPFGHSYIAASYVKYLKDAGARVIPIPYHASREEIDRKLDIVDGILFPGGTAHLTHSTFFNTGVHILHYVLEKNKNGVYMPLWGTCLGFEFLGVLTSATDRLIRLPLQAENIALPLKFSPDFRNSRMFGSMPEEMIQELATEPITINFHEAGISPSTFERNKFLHHRFRVLSTSQDPSGDEFASTIEGRDGLPIYATQWHPEKASYEPYSQPILDPNYRKHAQAVSQYFARFLVEEARKNTRPKTVSDDVIRLMDIDTVSVPIYTREFFPQFEFCYFFS